MTLAEFLIIFMDDINHIDPDISNYQLLFAGHPGEQFRATVEANKIEIDHKNKLIRIWLG